MESHHNDGCPRCGGCLERTEDMYGPDIRCMACGRHKDLLQPPPERLALMMKIESHNDKVAAQKRPHRPLHDKPDGKAPHGGKRPDWVGGTRKATPEFLQDVQQGLADAKAGRWVSDEDLDAFTTTVGLAAADGRLTIRRSPPLTPA